MLAGPSRAVYASGECEIDLGRRELRVRGAAAPIGARTFEIMELLVRSAGELVTKDELMERVWPGAIVGDNAIPAHISAVRKALGSQRTLVKTESGRGYRLLGSWTARGADSGGPSASNEPFLLSGEARTNNFPLVVSNLIGRGRTVQSLRDLISAYRVVTLTGPGGIGKTVLAIEAARGVLNDYKGGGWFVELASLADPTLVPSAVAGVLGLKLMGDAILAEAVARAIDDANLLVVLDNCEHVINAAAELAETIARFCPRASVLTTSREVLRIAGEQVYRVPPLDVPEIGEKDPEQVLRCGAVELLIARTKALDPTCSPVPNDISAITAICQHLDGIPLAIEFAAARVATLGFRQVAAGLANRFQLLTSGRRTALPRHRTLRATLDWSYDLLLPDEQRLLRRLAIFPGGFTVEAAEAVGSLEGASDVTEGIAALIEKSLVAVEPFEAGSRWRLLEAIRLYALEKLAECGDADEAARCHAAYFRDFFVSAVADFRTLVGGEDLSRYGREIDNVRAALDWSFSSSGDVAIGVDLTAAYTPVWTNLSLVGECRDRCERALHSLDTGRKLNARLQMLLQIGLGNSLLHTLGPSEQARTVLIRALETADVLGDLDAQARTLMALSTVYVYRGEYSKAATTSERLREVASQIGDPLVVARADRRMGISLLTIGRLAEAQRCFERVIQSTMLSEVEPLPIWRESGDRAIARAMLARALWLQGFAERASKEARASLDELQAADHQLMVCRVLYYGICRIAPMTGDFAAAERAIARLIEAATSLNARFWMTAGQFLQGKLMVERGEFAEGLAVLRAAFTTCSETGWRLSYPEFSGSLALALAGLGRFDEARDAVIKAITAAGGRDDGQQWYAPELLRIKADILLRQSPDWSGLVEDCLEQAAEMAREQGALTWELRIALSLARFRGAQGRHDAVRQILAPVYDRFTEGFDTADLIAARTLLDGPPAASAPTLTLGSRAERPR